MKEIVKLITQWSDFQDVYPNASTEDFFRYELAKMDSGALALEHIKGYDPKETSNRFMKVISRLHLSYNVYLRIALKGTQLASTDKFKFLAGLYVLGESSKTEVINYAMMEMSTGSDILNRLLKDDFIFQRNDPNDKRAKLITITEKGTHVLQQCFKKTKMVRKILLKDLSENDMKICVQMLYPIEEKHSKLAVESKNKTIEELYKTEFKDVADKINV